MKAFSFPIISLMLLIPTLPIRAQGVTEMRDTLRSALIVGEKVARDAGTRIVTLPRLRGMVSATGDADVIKFAQTLPGVSTGAEGASAIYVRGGNIGSNLTTLDDVSLYGGSHMLGLSTAYPADIISEAVFRVGGFRGNESNITASHIGLKSADGSFTKPSFVASASTFMLGGTVSTPIVRNKLSLIGSIRISPLGPEFRAIQTLAGGLLDDLDQPRAVVFDAFTKAKWLIDKENELALSVFGSKDAYSYRYGGYSDESMGWGNLIINTRHSGRYGSWSIKDGLAYNHFSGQQGIVREMNGTENNLAIVSSLDELTADAEFIHPLGHSSNARFGIKERFAWFNPGASSTFKGSGPLRPLDSPLINHVSHTALTTLHGQWDYQGSDWLELMVSGRLNIHGADEAEDPSWKWRVDPEAGLQAHFNVTKWLALEATADWTVQYYHTLEGIPLGWSVDLLVPTTPSRPPERAAQYYAGVFLTFGNHRITVGAYDKAMEGLVYFPDAGMLFSPAISGWSNNIKVGSGTSRGVEVLYEKDGERMDWRVAYTLSKTDRTFEEVNGGQTFPAKYDRRHILNATAALTVLEKERWSLALTSLFTFQSGHWETVAAGEYPAVVFFGEEYTLDYFTKVNNYEMPAYIRFDMGCNFKFKTRYPQELNIGIYNMLNRHNPFSIVYDDRTREWKQVSLFPILPSLNYRISF